MGFSEFIRERQFLSNVSPSTLEWYKHSFKWLDTDSPTQEDLKTAVLKMRAKGLRATGCNSAIRAINAYVHWANAGPNGSLLSGNESVGVREMLLYGSFGHRWFNGRAEVETVESLRQEQEHWRGLLRNRTRLRGAFGPGPSGDSRPYDKDRFALESKFGNTLEVHMEWRGRVPYAVIQPVTGRELLVALAWIDLVTGAECKVCQKCGIEYSIGGRKFCSWQCEHANTMRNYRKRIKVAEKRLSNRQI